MHQTAATFIIYSHLHSSSTEPQDHILHFLEWYIFPPRTWCWCRNPVNSSVDSLELVVILPWFTMGFFMFFHHWPPGGFSPPGFQVGHPKTPCVTTSNGWEQPFWCVSTFVGLVSELDVEKRNIDLPCVPLVIWWPLHRRWMRLTWPTFAAAMACLMLSTDIRSLAKDLRSYFFM